MNDGTRDQRPALTCACAQERRDFLRQAVRLALVAAAGTEWLSGRCEAFPLTMAPPTAVAGQTLTYPVPAVDGVTVDRDNGVILVRHRGTVMAFNLSCPHENAAVRWKSALGRFECSRHDSVYTPAGVYTSGRATRHMDRFPIRKNGSSVEVDVSRLIQSDRERTAWEGAAVAV